MSYDAIVVGAGHNGLVAALRLAQKGRSVLVLEQAERPGGLCAADEFHPGFRVPGVLHDDGGFSPALARKLGIAEDLRFEPAPPVWVPPVSGEVPGTSGGFFLDRDPARGGAELGADAAAYGDFRGFLAEIRGVVRGLLGSPPPPLRPVAAGDFWRLAREGLGLRRLGRKRMAEFLRVLAMPAADWLGDTFENQALAEALAGPVVMSTYMGPRSPGSSWNLVALECGAEGWIQGGPARLVEALGAAAAGRGVEIRTGAAVAAVRVRAGAAEGVTLESGEEIDAPLVASSCDPKQTMLRLVHPRELSSETQRGFEVLRARGSAARVHLALAGDLDFSAARVGGGDLDSLERAYDAIKYGEHSERPFLDVRVPSAGDPSLAPEGHHVVSILAAFAPYGLAGGWDEAARGGLGEAVLGQLERAVPDVRERLVGMEVLTPVDLERRYRTSGGHLHHGEHALDQMLFARPTPDTAGYGTPIAGLYLCGSGSHPGGGVTGLPGWLGAGAALRETG